MEGKVVERTNSLFPATLLRLRAGKEVDIKTCEETHICDATTCVPESEAMLVARGALSAPSLTCNVFLCNVGCVHICTQDSCSLYHSFANGTCPVSSFQFGINVSSYSKDDYRTWKNPRAEHQLGVRRLLPNGQAPDPVPAPKKRRKVHGRQLSEEDARAKASKMVKLLIYSKYRRDRIDQAIERNRQEGINAKHTYVREQHSAGQLPYVPDLYRVGASFSSREVSMKEFAYNEHTHNYYVFVILHVWNVLQRFHVPRRDKRFSDPESQCEIVPRIDFESVSLGTLYAMRKGVIKRGTELLPCDNFLLLNLPSINELTYFGLEKSLVTKGDKLISAAYDNAFGDGASIGDIVIDMDKIPERHESRIIVQSDSSMLKISSSGEKLFMPVSRKKKSK